jgi:hypothetical protein
VWEVTSLAFYREKNASTRKTHLYFLCLLSCSREREHAVLLHS